MNSIGKIDELTFIILREVLFEMVPNFSGFLEKENEHIQLTNGVYLFMYDFATFLGNELITNTAGSNVQKSFDYINRLADSNNLEIINILKIGILEILYSAKNIDRRKVASFLNERGQNYFIEISKNYH